LVGGTGGSAGGGSGTCTVSPCDDGSGGTSSSGGSGSSATSDSGNADGNGGGGTAGGGNVGGAAGSHPDDDGGGSGAGGGSGEDGGPPPPPIGDASPCSGEITFTDLNLQDAAVKAINKPPPILGEDAALVTTLEVTFSDARPLRSLRGLECFPALQSFSADGPDLRSLGSLDLSPLVTLGGLTSFAISANQDVDYGAPFAYLDLSPLERVPTIVSLVLRTNAIANIAPLALLPNLSVLSLHSNTLTDLSPLAGATKLLSRTTISGKRITDIAPLADALRGSKARTIMIGPSGVSDLSPLARATTLSLITVTDSPVADLAPLAALPGLTGLAVPDCEVTNIVLGPSVTSLDLSGNRISDWSPLASSRVHKLTVRRNRITDLAPFVAIKTLDNGGLIDVLENPYDCATQITNIWALQQRGVEVRQDCQP
jgi:hypothetical protein